METTAANRGATVGIADQTTHIHNTHNTLGESVDEEVTAKAIEEGRAEGTNGREGSGCCCSPDRQCSADLHMMHLRAHTMLTMEARERAETVYRE